MNNKKEIEYILHTLSNKPVAFYPIFAKVLGGVNEAIFFQQIFFWSDKGKRSDGYIYKTKDEIREETTLTYSQQDRVRKNLKKLGVIETDIFRANGSPTLHYRVNIGILGNLMLQDKEVKEISISESTTEKTKESSFTSKEVNTSSSLKKEEENKKANELKEYFVKCMKEFDPSIKLAIGGKEIKRLKEVLKILSHEDIRNMIDNSFDNQEIFVKNYSLCAVLSNNEINKYQRDYK